MFLEAHIKFGIKLFTSVLCAVIFCTQLIGQSSTKGNTFVHSQKEMSIFGAHSFTNGGSGLMPGVVGTKRNNPTYLSFTGAASVSSVSDAAHVDGYVKNYNIPDFTFPTGDNGMYGPVRISTTSLNSPVSAAYFKADPNTAVTSSLLGGNEMPLPAGAPFSTAAMGPGIFKVSKEEYWDINGTANVQITLYWKAQSQINILTGNMLSSLRLSGWDGTKWVEIPATINPGSTLTNGSISTNASLPPDMYNVYTFAATDCINKALLTVGNLTCLGNSFDIGYLTNGTAISTNAGTITGSTVTNIPSGTNLNISADNGIGCLNTISVAGPPTCPATCIMPILSVGQSVCNGPGSTTYGVSFTELTGADINHSSGIRSGNIITNIPLGTSLTITASNGPCIYSLTVSSPPSCTNPCENPRISISGPQCGPNNSTYFVNFLTLTGATVTSDYGTVSAGKVTNIPLGSNPKITVQYPGCQPQTMEIKSPVCRNTSAIGNFVWHDLNGNGQQDIGEPGIAGLQVNLFRSNGAFISTAFTDNFGKYIFDYLYPGYYYLEFKTPSGYERTFSNVGNDNTDNDIDGTNGVGTTSATQIVENERDMTIAAGFFKCVPIGQLVWYDINKNDVWDSNENGINGLKVNLWRNNLGRWGIYDFKITGQKPGTPSDDGYFLFCAPPGEYYVEVIMPPLGLVRVRPNIGNNRQLDSDINSNGTTDVFQLLSGQSKTDIGAGFYPMAIAGNLVWKDNNFNGIQDANEPRASGVKVEAIELLTGKVIKTAFTDSEGIYQLDYLEKQPYYMRFSPPSGYGATIPRATVDNLDSDVDNSFGPNTTRAFYFEAEQRNDDIDMGLAFGVLPVNWLDISAIRVNNTHIVSWRTSGEINVSHYELERKMNNEIDFTPMNVKIEANKYSGQVNNYTHTDQDVDMPGVYYYRIKQLDYDGQHSFSRIVKLDHSGVDQVSLYPNPARSETKVQITISQESEVVIELFDSSSKLFKVLKQSDIQKSGAQSYSCSLEDVPVGAYNIIVTIDGIKHIRKLIRVE